MSGVISFSKLQLVYHNMISRTSHWGGGVGSGVSNSSPLPLVYHNMIVEYLIGDGGGKSGEWGE